VKTTQALDRHDLAQANAAQGFPRLAGIILNGGLKPRSPL